MDPMSVMAIAGIGSTLLQGLFSAGSNASNAASVRETNLFNKMNVDNTNALNEKLQREQWARDDSQYQRMVSDMQAAGLNPLSGGSPSSSPLTAQMQASQAVAPQIDPRSADFLSQLPQVLLQSKMLAQRDKELNIKSIVSGIDPRSADSDNTLLNDYRNAIKALGDLRSNQAAEASKNASSPYVRGEGTISQTLKDIKPILKSGVEILDNVINSQPKKSPVHDSNRSNHSAQNANPHYVKKNSLINRFRNFVRGK